MDLNINTVLISDKVDGTCKDYLIGKDIQVDYKPGLSKDELKVIIQNYDALIVRSATKVTADVFENAKRLKLVGRAGTGVDNIDIQAASKNGVLVMNTPGGNTLSAAEHTCALIAALARHIGKGCLSMKEGKWERSKFMGCELNGKTLAIIGLGRIGREVAFRMQAYGMKTIGFDPLVPAEESLTFGVQTLPLSEIWPQADFVTVHTPLIPATKGLINASVFDVCKPSMKVVNVARGGIIDEAHLLDALNNGKCGGAALDVFVTEPPAGVSLELVKHPNAICTPHLGASTKEAQLRVAKEIAEQIVDAKDGKPMVGLVNAPSLAECGNPLYSQWVRLAEMLGRIVSKLETDLNVFHLSLQGKLLASADRLIGTAFSYGVAKQRYPSANLITCRDLLKENGIEVKTSKSTDASSFPSIVITTNSVGNLSGMVAGGSPFLTSIYGVSLRSPLALTGNLLLARSKTQSPVDLMKKATGDFEVMCLSLGVGELVTVLAAVVNGLVEQSLQEPFVFIQW